MGSASVPNGGFLKDDGVHLSHRLLKGGVEPEGERGGRGCFLFTDGLSLRGGSGGDGGVGGGGSTVDSVPTAGGVKATLVDGGGVGRVRLSGDRRETRDALRAGSQVSLGEGLTVPDGGVWASKPREEFGRTGSTGGGWWIEWWSSV